MDNFELQEQKKQMALINETVSNEIYNLGDSFFEQIVIKLNDALGADYTYIGTLNDSKNEMTTISLVNKEGLLDNFTYHLKDTPCENVVGQAACTYAKDVTALFPKDQLLADMEIEAYTGIPLYNSKSNSIGILVCMFKKEIHNIHTYESLLLIFASRAGAELEHKKLYTSLDEHKKELESKVLERTKELHKKNKELELANIELGLTVSQLQKLKINLYNLKKWLHWVYLLPA